MVEFPAVSVLHTSVVLVSPAPIDPQSIRPEALSNAGIVPVNWVPTGGISIPVVAQTLYQNGFTFQVEGNRCVLQEPVGGALRDTYEVHAIAKGYVDATKLVPYTAVGINWLLGLSVENPAKWLQEKLMGDFRNFSDFRPASLQISKQLGFVTCNLNFRSENDRISVDCNYHFQIEHSSPEVIATTLASWWRCQEHLTGEVLPQL